MNAASNEPVTVSAALSSAVNATLGLLGLLFNWDAEVSAALLVVSASWITALAIVVGRANSVPVGQVALTRAGEARLLAAGFRPPSLAGGTP